jgi:hypothetical protein
MVTHYEGRGKVVNSVGRTAVLVGALLVLFGFALPVEAQQHIMGNQAVASSHSTPTDGVIQQQGALFQASTDAEGNQPHTSLAEGTFEGDSPLMMVLIALGMVALGRALLKQTQG